MPRLARWVRIHERSALIVCMETAYSYVGILHSHLGDLRIGVANSPVRLGRGAEELNISVSAHANDRAR